MLAGKVDFLEYTSFLIIEFDRIKRQWDNELQSPTMSQIKDILNGVFTVIYLLMFQHSKSELWCKLEKINCPEFNDAIVKSRFAAHFFFVHTWLKESVTFIF